MYENDVAGVQKEVGEGHCAGFVVLTLTFKTSFVLKVLSGPGHRST